MKKAKRLLLLYFPYVLFALLATKLGQAWRYAPGTGFSEKGAVSKWKRLNLRRPRIKKHQ